MVHSILGLRMQISNLIRVPVDFEHATSIVLLALTVDRRHSWRVYRAPERVLQVHTFHLLDEWQKLSRILYLLQLRQFIKLWPRENFLGEILIVPLMNLLKMRIIPIQVFLNFDRINALPILPNRQVRKAVLEIGNKLILIFLRLLPKVALLARMLNMMDLLQPDLTLRPDAVPFEPNALLAFVLLGCFRLAQLCLVDFPWTAIVVLLSFTLLICVVLAQDGDPFDRLFAICLILLSLVLTQRACILLGFLLNEFGGVLAALCVHCSDRSRFLLVLILGFQITEDTLIFSYIGCCRLHFRWILIRLPSFFLHDHILFFCLFVRQLVFTISRPISRDSLLPGIGMLDINRHINGC